MLWRRQCYREKMKGKRAPPTPGPGTAPRESSATAVWILSTLVLLDINLNGLWNGLLLGVLVKTAKAESLNLFFSLLEHKLGCLVISDHRLYPSNNT